MCCRMNCQLRYTVTSNFNGFFFYCLTSDELKQRKVLATWNKADDSHPQHSTNTDTSHSSLNRIRLNITPVDVTPVESDDEETNF